MATPEHRKPRTKSHSATPNSTQINESREHLPCRKNLFGFLSLTRLGCGRFSSPAVAVHASVPKRTTRRRRRKKQRKNRGSSPENVCCTPPGIGFTYDVAQSTTSDAHRRHHRQRSRVTMDLQQPGSRSRSRSRSSNAHIDDATTIRSNVSADPGQYNRLLRPSAPGGISEIVMIEHNPLLDGRLEGSDRFGAWRINADLMSYEELVELSDRIGYVDGGLQEEEILDCLKRPKRSFFKSYDFNSKVKDSKCSICQEECKGDEDLGRLDCGHYHHLDCIKQWLLRKNECPVCKTVAKLNK